MQRLGLVTCACLALVHAPLCPDDRVVPDKNETAEERQKVLGIGGLFFRSDDPAALAQWYKERLGIDPVPTSYEVEPWKQEGGLTVFSPFPAQSTQMGNPGRGGIINFRVADINAFVAQLHADGVEVTLDPTTYPNGRFATLNDPEGNPIQLWEPAIP